MDQDSIPSGSPVSLDVARINRGPPEDKLALSPCVPFCAHSTLAVVAEAHPMLSILCIMVCIKRLIVAPWQSLEGCQKPWNCSLPGIAFDIAPARMAESCSGKFAP